MRTLLITGIFLALILNACNTNKQANYTSEKEYKLIYNKPADAMAVDDKNGWKDDMHWLSALPLGNGSLGIMVFGDVNKERLQLNEESMWSGSPDDNNNPNASKNLDKIRKLLFEGKYKEATELTNRTQICKGKGSGHGNGSAVPFGSFQTLGDLYIDFDNKSSFSNYHRELDLNDAVVRVSYTQNGVDYKREIFTSYPAQLMVAKFTASEKGKISFRCNMNRPERYRTFVKDKQLIMQGALKDGRDGDYLQYMTRLKAVNKGGEVIYADSILTIKNADEVILFLAASTDYKLEYPNYKGRDYVYITNKAILKAVSTTYDDLLQEHLKEYQSYFNRVNLSLTDSVNTAPIDECIKAYKHTNNDNQLVEIFFQYGRYLLISSSRPGTLPANLQGLWANKIQTPWNGDYHTDVNIEMNYWPAEVTNLSELHLPMFDLIESLVEPGKKTAEVHYNAKGWVVHPITNVWGYTAPGERASWGMHTGAGAWICSHISEHYRFTEDEVFLKKMYPVLKSSAQFYLDWLVPHPETGKLVSGPACSPENTFTAPDGSKNQICMGPTHDQQVIRQLFTDFLTASEILKVSDDFVQQINEAKKNLAGNQIGSDGRLMEWPEEFPEVEPGHRHISHLFDLHPGNQINLNETPELAAAAKKSLDFRIANGGGHTGWSAAWLISQYARLQEAENAKRNLDVVLSKSITTNLFGLHPPFQMDANFGTTAGIAEMLLQSHTGEIHLLPALPTAWPDGEVKGLCARGGFDVEIKWSNGELVSVKILSKLGNDCIIRYREETFNLKTEKKEAYSLNLENFKK
jgi:alpha-L-fucosidase 2